MEIKKTDKKNKEQQYFEDLLARIQEIRASEKTPRQKMYDIVKCAIDYNAEDGRVLISLLSSRISRLGPNGDLRFVNCMIMHVALWAASHHPMTMKDIEIGHREWLKDADNDQHIYESPSFRGIYEKDEYEEDCDSSTEYSVSLPKELEGFKGGSMILKIEDMDRFIDTFCSRDTYYRRAYDILAELDKQVLKNLEEGVFPKWIDVLYKKEGWAMFEFSHFEVDLREPDEKYRTLYVVYRYDTTAS